MNYTAFLRIAVLMIPLLACNTNENKAPVKIELSLQESIVSNTSIRSSLLYPVLEFENLSMDSIFVYFTINPTVIIDSINSIIELRYNIESLPENFTYYDFRYPTFVGINPQSRMQYFHEIEFMTYFEKLHTGTWNVFATVGYLPHMNQFIALRSHKLRESIVINQNTVKTELKKLRIYKK